MTHKTIIRLLGVAAVLTALLASCNDKENYAPNPNNPPAQILPQKAFTVTVCEEEPGVEADSTYRFFAEIRGGAPDGKVTFTKVCGVDKNGDNKKIFDTTPDVVELVLTPWNSISFEFTAEVNAFSSTDIIDVKKTTDLKHYVLSAKKSGTGNAHTVQEGYADISFWNGDRETAVVIRVRTANHIDVEGFEVKFDGKPFTLVPMQFKYTLNTINPYNCTMGELPNVSYPYEHYWETLRKIGDFPETRHLMPFEELYDMSKVKEIEFVGTVPRNATPDNAIVQINDPLCYGHHDAWSKDHQIIDWNRTKYGEFRWAPFHEDYRKPSSTVVEGRAKFNVYPADLRYLKAQIWDIVDNLAYDKHIGHNFYFCYETQNGDSSTYWWGCIVNEPGKNL